MRSLGAVLGGPRRLEAAERLAGIVAQPIARRGFLGRLPLPGLAGAWFRARDMRAPARASFRRWWRREGGGPR